MNKCQFFREASDYSGHIFLSGCLQVSGYATSTVADLQHDTNQIELYSIFKLL